MKLRIHNQKYEDYIDLDYDDIESDNIDDFRDYVNKEMKKRGWKQEDCFSENII